MIDWLRRSGGDPIVELAGRPVPLAIRRHPRARRMTLRLASDGSEVKVTLPQWGRTADALEFANRKREWLEGQLEKLPLAAPPEAGGMLSYRGEDLRIEWAAKASRKPMRAGDAILLGGPHESLARRLQRWLEGEALALMGIDLVDYCTAAGREVPDLRLSRAQRRWGSCSGTRTIRLNWRLVQAPDAVRRSVVAHEVAHLVHFDHGPQFHELLGELYEGDIAEANRWLKLHGRSLYAMFG